MKLYLASPYSHKDPEVRLQRFEAANKKAAELMREGHTVFSPLSHSHPISLHMDNCLDHDFWLKQDMAFLEWCDAIYLLCTDGWLESKGIAVELEWARRNGRPVIYGTV